MPQEIPLPEQNKAALRLHHLSAKQGDQLLRWLDELVQFKSGGIAGCKTKMEEIQAAADSLEREIENLQRYKQSLIADTKNNLELILKKVVADLGIGPNSKAKLVFEGDEPKILLQD